MLGGGFLASLGQLYGSLWFAALLTLAVTVPSYSFVRYLGRKVGWAQETGARVAKGFLWAGGFLFAVVLRLEFVVAGSGFEGMEWDSPNGQYNAQCKVGTVAFFFGGQRDFVQFQITERASGKQVVQIEEPRSGPTQHLSVRGNGRVLWTPDSKHVSFSFGEDYRREFEVP